MDWVMSKLGGRSVGIALTVFSLGVGSAQADTAGLRERIERRLSQSGVDQRGQVQVEVVGGAAVLSGFANTIEIRQQAAKAARKETKSVENRIRVVPLENRDTAAISRDVTQAILGDVYYGVFDSVGFELRDGVLMLNGSVRHPWRKSELERRVGRVDGVREIQNQIRVQPVSTFDDRLRLQLYHRIYGHGLFQRYAAFPDPPIRIIVENGNITLTGLVSSPVEKAVLGSIARGLLAFRVDNLVQVESEIRKEPGQASD
jgi:osmotically-inducible protein OsmY